MRFCLHKDFECCVFFYTRVLSGAVLFAQGFWVLRFFYKGFEWCGFVYIRILSDAVLFAQGFWVLRFFLHKGFEWCGFVCTRILSAAVFFAQGLWVVRFFLHKDFEWCVFWGPFRPMYHVPKLKTTIPQDMHAQNGLRNVCQFLQRNSNSTVQIPGWGVMWLFWPKMK